MLITLSGTNHRYWYDYQAHWCRQQLNAHGINRLFSDLAEFHSLMGELAVAWVVWVGRGRPDDDIPTYLQLMMMNFAL